MHTKTSQSLIPTSKRILSEGAPVPPRFLRRPHRRADVAAERCLAKKSQSGIMEPASLPPQERQLLPELGNIWELEPGPGSQEGNYPGLRTYSVPSPVLGAFLWCLITLWGMRNCHTRSRAGGAGERRASTPSPPHPPSVGSLPVLKAMCWSKDCSDFD